MLEIAENEARMVDIDQRLKKELEKPDNTTGTSVEP